MKKLTIIVLLAIVTVSNSNGQQAFSNVSLNKVNDRNVISFTLPRESNVYQYRIEGSNDGVDFEIVSTIHPTGNSMLAKNYSYELYEPAYKIYRVGIVGMNAKLEYSSNITTKKETHFDAPDNNKERAVTGPTIVTKF